MYVTICGIDLPERNEVRMWPIGTAYIRTTPDQYTECLGTAGSHSCVGPGQRFISWVVERRTETICTNFHLNSACHIIQSESLVWPSFAKQRNNIIAVEMEHFLHILKTPNSMRRNSYIHIYVKIIACR